MMIHVDSRSVYEGYMEAFKNGISDYIVEDYDEVNQEIMSRKYFSGGLRVDNDFEWIVDQNNKSPSTGDRYWINGGYKPSQPLDEDNKSSVKDIEEDLKSIPINTIKNTTLVSDDFFSIIRKIENNDVNRIFGEIAALGSLIEIEAIDYTIIHEMKIFQKILKILDEGNHYTRRKVVDMLGQSVKYWGDLKDDITNRLFLALNDSESLVRLGVVETLKQVALNDRQSIDDIMTQLKKMLDDEDLQVRRTSIEVLYDLIIDSNRYSSDKIDILFSGLKSKDFKIRAMAIDFIGKILAENNEMTAKLMPILLNNLESDNYFVRDSAIEILRAVVSQWQPYLSQISQILISLLQHESSSVRFDAAQALVIGLDNWNAQIMSQLVAAMNNFDHKVDHMIFEVLRKSKPDWGKFSSEILTMLLTALEDKNYYISQSAVEVLGIGVMHWQDSREKVFRKLQSALDDVKSDVREEVMVSLIKGAIFWNYWDINLINSINEYLNYQDFNQGEVLKFLSQAMFSSNLNIETKKDILSKLLELLKSSKTKTRVYSIAALTEFVIQSKDFGSNQQDIVKAILESIEDQSSDVRIQAIKSLAKIRRFLDRSHQLSDKITITLIKMLENSRDDIKFLVADTLTDLMVNTDILNEYQDEIIDKFMTMVKSGKIRDLDLITNNLQKIVINVRNQDKTLVIIDFLKSKALFGNDLNLRIKSLAVLGDIVVKLDQYKKDIMPVLLSALQDNIALIRRVAIEKSKVSLWKQQNISDEEYDILLDLLKDVESIKDAATIILKTHIQEGRLNVLPLGVMRQFYNKLIMKGKDKHQFVSDDALNIGLAFILKSHTSIKGSVDSDDVDYIDRMMGFIVDPENLRHLTKIIREWSMAGSMEAQAVLDRRIQDVLLKEKDVNDLYVEVSEKDNVYIDEVIRSQRRQSLLPFVISNNFHPSIRMKVIRALAQGGEIDSGLRAIESDLEVEYLDILSRAYDQTGRIITKKLVDKIYADGTTISVLNDRWPWIIIEDALKPYRNGEKTIKLDEVQFERGGNAIANFREFMMDVVKELPSRKIQRPVGLPTRRYLRRSKFPIFNIINSKDNLKIIKGTTVNLSLLNNTYGRTFEFRSENKAVHLKFLKKDDDPHRLIYEYDMMNFLGSKKKDWGLKGLYPQGRVRIGRIKVEDIPEGYLDNLQAKNQPIKLNTSDGYFTFMAYEVGLINDQNTYTTYQNDPDLSNAEFMKSLQINIHDRLVMAQHGLFDLEMIELFHNRDDLRRYNLMVDINHHQEGREGAGRLEDLTGATLFPNIRLSGPADFESIYFIEDIMKDSRVDILSDFRITGIKKIMGNDILRAKELVMAALLANTLLSLVLMIPTYLERGNKLYYGRERRNRNTDLKNGLKLIFEEAYKVFSSSNDLPQEIMTLNYQLMAQQMAYFITDRYLKGFIGFFHNFPTKKLYPQTNVTIDWNEIFNVRILNRKRGWDYVGQEYSIPTRNAELKINRRSRDLGFLNGFNPLQELVKSLYISTTMMLVGSYDGSVRTLASLNKNKLSEQKDTVYRNEMNIVNSANNPGGINFYATELEVYSKSRPSSNIQHIQPAEQQHAVQIQHGLEVFIDSVLLYK